MKRAVALFALVCCILMCLYGSVAAQKKGKTPQLECQWRGNAEAGELYMVTCETLPNGIRWRRFYHSYNVIEWAVKNDKKFFQVMKMKLREAGIRDVKTADDMSSYMYSSDVYEYPIPDVRFTKYVQPVQEGNGEIPSEEQFVGQLIIESTGIYNIETGKMHDGNVAFHSGVFYTEPRDGRYGKIGSLSFVEQVAASESGTHLIIRDVNNRLLDVRSGDGEEWNVFPVNGLDEHRSLSDIVSYSDVAIAKLNESVQNKKQRVTWVVIKDGQIKSLPFAIEDKIERQRPSLEGEWSELIPYSQYIFAEQQNGTLLIYCVNREKGLKLTGYGRPSYEGFGDAPLVVPIKSSGEFIEVDELFEKQFGPEP